MLDFKYYIGIDFGHGETSVSRVPGLNGNPVSRIPLRISGNFAEQKVYSAICRDDNGKWKFVGSKDDLKRKDVKEGFKGMIHTLDDEKREALCEFAKLVFKTILNNDKELHYNPETGEANFVICIANPSDWRRQNINNPKEYLTFFQKEAGIKPAKMCINESDAAFYTKFKGYTPSDKVFVIDLGSSTIDFTTYQNSICNHECCWGANLGAHLVEDKLVDFGYTKAEEKKENIEGMHLVTHKREELYLGPAESALSLAARFAKESYFTKCNENDGGISTYELDVKVRDLVPNWDKKTQRAFSVIIDSPDVNTIIQDYISALSLALSNATKKLQGYGISPNKVLLSGGASRMPFVKKLTEEAFPNAEIVRDNYPEWVVSDGAALYAKTHIKALEDRNKLQEEFATWAKAHLDDKLKSAAVSSFNSILKDTLRNGLEKRYLNDSSGSLNDLEQISRGILEGITKTIEFKSKADKQFIAVVDGFIKAKLEEIIKSNYGKVVTISENFIDPGDTFNNVGVKTDFLHDFIAQIADHFCNNFLEGVDDLNWSRARSNDKRHAIITEFLANIDYDRFNHNIDLNEFISQAVDKIDKVLHDNGLFQISE